MSQVSRRARGNDRFKRDSGGRFKLDSTREAIDWRRTRCLEGIGGTEEDHAKAGRIMRRVFLQALTPRARARGSAAKARFQGMLYTCNRAGLKSEEITRLIAIRATQGHDLATIDPERLCAKVIRPIKAELVGIFHITEFKNFAGILLHGLRPGIDFGKGGRIHVHASSFALFDPRDTVLGPRLKRNDYSTKMVVVIDNSILDDELYHWLISSANGTLLRDRVIHPKYIRTVCRVDWAQSWKKYQPVVVYDKGLDLTVSSVANRVPEKRLLMQEEFARELLREIGRQVPTNRAGLFAAALAVPTSQAQVESRGFCSTKTSPVRHNFADA
jgi:hypothetical protein